MSQEPSAPRDELPLPPSGEQTELVNGDATVVLTEVGAGLRSYRIGGEDVVFGYPADELCSGGKGQVLAPWPNRLDEGRYEFGGETGAAALDEPDRRNAIHGLVRWSAWELLERSAHAASFAFTLCPQPGYPWRIELRLDYDLASPRELVVGLRVVNRSPLAAPFGVGFHPYLAAGEGGADACRLRFFARTRLLTDDRGLPCGQEPVAGTAHAFSAGRSLRDVRLDDCFTGLAPTENTTAAWRVELERGDGRIAAVSGGSELGYVMCYTADTLAPPERRKGVAVEPMSCPANALRSGEGLVVLAGDGGSWQTSWRLSALRW